MVVINRGYKLKGDESCCTVRLERFIIETCLANPDLSFKVIKQCE